MPASVSLAIERAWYSSPGLLWLLTPLEAIFAVVTAVRRWLYRSGALSSAHPGGTVVVVGNLTAGGSGKTPVVVAIAEALLARGVALAVVSRGYGGGAEGVLKVGSDTDVGLAGDEPAWMARRLTCPVYVGRDRVAAARKACAEGADVVLCDDGLQHYRLQRDLEILVLDAHAPGGNGHLLPVGPLREGLWRAQRVDFVLEHGGPDGGRSLVYAPARLRSLVSGECRAPAEPGFGPGIHALAAIARPARFFSTLRDLGFEVCEHALPDHAEIPEERLQALGDRPLVVTSKDEPKIPSGAHRDVWVLEMDLNLPIRFIGDLLGALSRRGCLQR